MRKQNTTIEKLMKLHVLGSSSAGNCYLLESSDKILIIEAGIQFREIEKVINWQINRIAGCLVSHEHGDHAKYVHNFLQRGIRILSTEAVIKKALNNTDRLYHFQTYKLHDFTIVPFLLSHDVECFGFYIHHPEMGFLLFVTDTGKLPYKFAEIDHLLIESNYSDQILQHNVFKHHISNAQVARLADTHLSIDKAAKWIKTTKPKLQTVVLLHLSNGNSNAEQFRQTMYEQTGLYTYIAEKGLSIEINKYPF